jgi:uncharacterized protein YjiS (DUF1127 family)
MDRLLQRHANAGHRTVHRRLAQRILAALFRALERSRQRRALAQLSDARLRDIGLTRQDVAGETAKPFWRP